MKAAVPVDRRPRLQAPALILQRCGGRNCSPGTCNHDQESVLRQPRGPSAVSLIVQQGLQSPAQPLDQETRYFMESRFGHDFSRVRVHSDATAADSANGVNALAYTVGQDIVFGAGQYAPGTDGGSRMLAHELTHVVQQGSRTVDAKSPLRIGVADSPLEHEADQAAEQVRGPMGSPASRLVREPANTSAFLFRQPGPTAPGIEGPTDDVDGILAEPASSDCETGCKALESMRNTVRRLCELAGERDERCKRARQKLSSAEARVAASCTCGAPVPIS
jgi:hypothetical protein